MILMEFFLNKVLLLLLINLVWRVGVEQVRVGAVGTDEERKNFVGVLGVLQTRPKAEPPRDRPARGIVTAKIQRLLHRFRQLRRAAQGDLRAREKAVEVRDVAVVAVARFQVPIFEPFLELAGLADLIGRQPGASDGELFTEGFVRAENLRSLNAVAEQVADDLVDHRRTGTEARAQGMAVLRRRGWTSDEPLVPRFLDQ